jgi:uncharacterized protein YbjT (DUF2867 family)
MRVLVTGAHGFIGRALCPVLAARGHTVVAGVHRTPARRAPPAGAAEATPTAATPREVGVEFVRDTEPLAWRQRLDGVDAVINTVGLIREHGAATFQRVHVQAAVALFDACVQAGIRHVVQLSALGADAFAQTAYQRTKHAADEALLERIPTAWCAQPSLVFGSGGTSARLFLMLASLPVVPVPGDGQAAVQPIHVADLVDALCALVEREGAGGRIALVGPAPLPFAQLLLTLRAGLGLRDTRVVRVPWPLMRAAAGLGAWLPHSLLDRDTLAMLARGNAADAHAVAALLGHAPRPVRAFIAPGEAPPLRTAARLRWLLPLLRGSVALVWIATGIVSLGLFPIEQSYALLARTGVPAALAPLMLYGAALLDLALGVLVPVLRGRRRRLLWRVQFGLVLFYSVVIAWRLPEYWLHPYGPLTKNLPLLAVLVLLDVLEPGA